MYKNQKITFSIVSHGQGRLVRQLLEDLRHISVDSYEIILTLNIVENESFVHSFNDLPLTIIRNSSPKGFGENHNCAYRISSGDIFVVINPDIRIPNPDFSRLFKFATQDNVGACAPIVVNSNGLIEDSARIFPTIWRLLYRVLLRRRSPDYNLKVNSVIPVDWVAGMFIAIPRRAFECVGGFDVRYFMYMEDADLCRRLRNNGFNVIVDCSTKVVHDAQRQSLRSLRHLIWHISSARRFLLGF